MRSIAPRLALFALGLALLGWAHARLPLQDAEPEVGPRWWKGNTHTHTLWSDGDGAPEQVAAWYRGRGYHFLVLSDHNVLSQGERWFPIEENGRLSEERVEALRQTFGDAAVEVREREGAREMRLWTLEELRDRFEEPGRFLFIQGEEVTDSFEKKPVHVNGLNLAELVRPQGGASVREVLNANVAAIAEQGRRLERPVLAHVNHPNFQWGLTWQDVAHVEGDRFFEVYNGHSGVRNYGDAEHPGMEEMWDRALALRLTELDLGVLYGLATDDAHHYFRWGVGNVNPGRGWVMVRAERLEAGALLEALERGDFYASSGVTLAEVGFDGRRYRIGIDAEPGVTYTTRFVGTRLAGGEPVAIGEVLAETDANPAEYEFHGDELYVRAVVVSSREHPNPYAAGDREMAWAQPVLPAH